MPIRKPARRRETVALRTDEEWGGRHFEELVDKYAGQYAVVACGELFVGDDPVPLEKTARRKHPNVMPQVLPIPRPEDFTCAL